MLIDLDLGQRPAFAARWKNDVDDSRTGAAFFRVGRNAERGRERYGAFSDFRRRPDISVDRIIVIVCRRPNDDAEIAELRAQAQPAGKNEEIDRLSVDVTPRIR